MSVFLAEVTSSVMPILGFEGESHRYRALPTLGSHLQCLHFGYGLSLPPSQLLYLAPNKNSLGYLGPGKRCVDKRSADSLGKLPLLVTSTNLIRAKLKRLFVIKFTKQINFDLRGLVDVPRES